MNVKGLHANSSDIKDLTGLEYGLNLKVLDLSSNDITEISPLADLTKHPKSGPVGQLNQGRIAAGLTNLQGLDLGGDPITGYSPLSGLRCEVIK